MSPAVRPSADPRSIPVDVFETKVEDGELKVLVNDVAGE
jgi:hypothetical protein